MSAIIAHPPPNPPTSSFFLLLLFALLPPLSLLSQEKKELKNPLPELKALGMASIILASTQLTIN